jgi:hypothetical protein
MGSSDFPDHDGLGKMIKSYCNKTRKALMIKTSPDRYASNPCQIISSRIISASILVRNSYKKDTHHQKIYY